MDALQQHDFELSRATPPGEKLVQALEMMEAGIRLKRAALRQAMPGASEPEIDAAVARWLAADA